jgi:hypothetical protein
MREFLAAVWLEGFYETWCQKRGFRPDRRAFYRVVKSKLRELERSRVYN